MFGLGLPKSMKVFEKGLSGSPTETAKKDKGEQKEG